MGDWVVGVSTLCSVEDLSDGDIEGILELTGFFKESLEKPGKCVPPFCDWLKGKIVGLLFFEPSTRTRYSFECAAKRLGAGVLSLEEIIQKGGEKSGGSSSLAKGESLIDTCRMFGGYCDLTVLRHPSKGVVKMMSLLLEGHSLINGGDGAGEHPTQALLDLFTIRTYFKLGAGYPLVRIAFVGDLLHGRTVHSLAKLLARYPNVALTFIAPDCLQIPDEFISHILPSIRALSWKDVDPNLKLAKKSKLESDFLPKKNETIPDYFAKKNELDCDILANADVLYATRLQKERIKFTNPQISHCADNLQNPVQNQTSSNQECSNNQNNHEKNRENDQNDQTNSCEANNTANDRMDHSDLDDQYIQKYSIFSELLDTHCKKSLIVMHPLPRLQEIHASVDKNPRQKYFEQALNGLYVRMAILALLLAPYNIKI